MIYEDVALDAPIRQGDIFIQVPKLEFSLEDIYFADIETDDGFNQASWHEIIKAFKLKEITDRIRVSVPITCVSAIVATQDCDARRGPDVTLCEIRRFCDVEKSIANATAPKRFVTAITKQSRINLKWFYLPPDKEIGFEEKMGADFQVTLRLQREELEKFRFLRKKRLNDVADEHFRERIAEFFRRYPYDEWYPLNKLNFRSKKKAIKHML